MIRGLKLLSIVLALLLCPTFAFGINGVRLIGITGNQGAEEDETLYDIDIATKAIQPILRLPFVPDTDSISFNPQNGLLYRASGASSYSNNPASNGFRDNHYMQTVDLLSGSLAQAAIYNANSEQFGLSASRPSWVLPTDRRTDSQTGAEFRVSGPNEYHAIRDFTWSASDNAFFAADEDGIFKITADGSSTFVGSPGGQPKGITFATIGGTRSLYLSDRDTAELWRVDPATGQRIGGSVMVKHPTNQGAFVDGLLSLVEVPDEPLLYAIQKTAGSPTNRNLLLIDPTTGDSHILMPLGTYMADLALIYESSLPGDMNSDGVVDRQDVALFAPHFGTATGSTTATGDFNGDGQTGLADLAILQANLIPSASPALSAATNVPEPATIVLGFVGAFFVVACRACRSVTQCRSRRGMLNPGRSGQAGVE